MAEGTNANILNKLTNLIVQCNDIIYFKTFYQCIVLHVIDLGPVEWEGVNFDSLGNDNDNIL